MNSRDGTTDGLDRSPSTESPAWSSRVDPQRVLNDLRAGLRTRHFLTTYGLTIEEFEEVLKDLIRKGLFSKSDFKEWKARKPITPGPLKAPVPGAPAVGPNQRVVGRTVTTYIIPEPEKTNSWALQLFTTSRERMSGASFKVIMHGKKYSFVVEKLVYRGPVQMLESKAPRPRSQEKREQAMEFIAKHGWAAYLENRAYAANFDRDGMREAGKARLVLLHCRNQTFVAALHTPAPAINLYVGSSLESIRKRLAGSIDTKDLKI